MRIEPGWVSATRAARTAKVEAYSSEAAIRRVQIPVSRLTMPHGRVSPLACSIRSCTSCDVTI